MKKTYHFYKKIFEDSPVGMTVCDSSGQAVEANDAICKIVGATKEQILAQNFHHLDSWKKSGLSKTADRAVSSGKAKTKKVTLTSSFGKELTANVNVLPFTDGDKDYVLFTFDDLAAVKKVEDERERLIAELRLAMSEIQTLRGILPLCSFCKKIRNDEGQWERIDAYIAKRSLADFSHGICPVCFKKHYPEAHKNMNGSTEDN